jgi:hypothetical protein
MNKVFENKLLRGIFESKREDLQKEWRNFHSEKHHGLHP